MTDFPRLIEFAFPLKQASLDSVHEKNVRHGHISTLHIWPARRPLAACRAALIATLLPDPSAQPKPEGMSDAEWQKEIQRRRKELCEKIGGKVVKRIERKKMPGGQVVEREKEETEGGILHWGRETENSETLEWFRQEIRKAYGGRAPKVLDPFAGGGAIPLEAMRLGCEATAIDINPVAWFILKCTLEYPQKLAGKTLPLPEFILKNREFMEAFFKSQGMSKKEITAALKKLDLAKDQSGTFFDVLATEDTEDTEKLSQKRSSVDSVSSVVDLIQADLAWHVRAWGQWVLDRARRELARFYPVYADFEPLEPGKPYQPQPMRLVPLKDDGTPDIDSLNAEFSKDYLADQRNPRWIAKPTVAYLWARTVTCKNCRATIPLLKTRWLCKKDRKRVLLTMKVEAASSPLASNPDMQTTRRDAASTLEDVFGYFDPTQPIGNISGNLPHWRQEGVTYFVTFRLADSLPQEKLQQWLAEREAWLRTHPEPHDHATRQEYDRLFPARFERWLDAGYGECILAHPEIQSIVTNALKHFDGIRYHLDPHFVVMPNHVHVLVTPLGEHSLSGIVHSWKSFTAHQINKLLGRSGTVWQKEYFDHIVRSPEHLERFRQYIRDNPKGIIEAASSPLASNPDMQTTRRDAASTIRFGIQAGVPLKGGNAAQRREHDKRIGSGTMSRAGATCPCCGTIMTMEDIRLEGRAGRLGTVATAVVVDGPQGKEYRLPTEHELAMAAEAQQHIDRVFAEIPFGLPEEPTPAGGGTGAGRAFSVQGYGLMRWRDLFTPRQLLALGTLVKNMRATKQVIRSQAYPTNWQEAVVAYLACAVGRFLDFCNCGVQWKLDATTINHFFVRFALPITWDFAEGNAIGRAAGSYELCFERICVALDNYAQWNLKAPAPLPVRASAKTKLFDGLDAIVTDPPYYDAIPYSDLMDFFYVWLRRTLYGLSPEFDHAFREPLAPKWDAESNDGELIDDASRHGGDAARSRAVYEQGIFRAFRACHQSLRPQGRMVVVFANKQPEAWEALVSAMIRAGFVVNGSWPIQTEMGNRTRALTGAALASSVWLVCKKRPESARPGWDNQVLDEMRARITQRLRDFWDAGIRGPDFVWAATGPALEAYSKHPVVKKADDPGQILTVSEFLSHVRRMVVDFVVGRVLRRGDVSSPGAADSGEDAAATVDRLDEPTAYYLLHRHDFGLEEAPVGACILYATACGLSDQALVRDWDMLVKSGSDVSSLEEEDGPDAEMDESEVSGGDADARQSGSSVQLKPWNQRRGRSMGYEAPGGRPVPLVDRIHRLMHLWKGGDVHKVDEYLDEHGLRRHELFRRVLQSFIELAKPGSEERSLLESLSNHIGAKGAKRKKPQPLFTFDDDK